jgi:hypothetical protein
VIVVESIMKVAFMGSTHAKKRKTRVSSFAGGSAQANGGVKLTKVNHDKNFELEVSELQESLE